MFEALFILTMVDAGTRVGRYMIQEVVGKASRTLGDLNNWPAVIVTSALISAAFGYLLYQNDISSIWPMFGVANQLLASLALVIGTAYLMRTARKKKYALVTGLPALFMIVTTLTAGTANIFDNYLPKGRAGDFNGYLNAGLTVIMMVCVVLVTIDGVAKISRAARSHRSAANLVR